MFGSVRIKDVRADARRITVVLPDGRELSMPTLWSSRLSTATQAQRDAFLIEPGGLVVAWDDANEHIPVWAFLGLSESEFASLSAA